MNAAKSPMPNQPRESSRTQGDRRIQGRGTMSDAIRDYPWETTPLGAIEDWPPELLGTVNAMLTSKQVVCVIWGETEQVLLYNDLYTPFLRGKASSLGQNFLDVWSEIRDQAAGIIGQPYLTQESNLFEHVPFFILVDGQTAERICTLTNNPIWSQSGESPRILGLCQTIVDHTDGELAMRKVNEDRERLAQVMAASRDAITLVDRNWRITYLNPTGRRIIGPENDFLGQDLWTCFPDIAREDSISRYHFLRAMNESIAASFETEYPEPYNLPIVVDVYPTDEGIVTFVRDISSAKRAEAALIQNEKLAAVGRLAASIAHEINNPLESVTNLLYLARQTPDPAELDEYLSIAERELRRVAVITNQTLRFYKQSSNPIMITGHELLDSVLSIYQGRLVNSNIQIEMRMRASASIVCYDGEIRQVLNNLVGNAIDAMSARGGRLLIRSRDTCHWQTGLPGIALTIADTGTGMLPETLGRLFEAFYTTKGIGGNGLGLWVSKEIVDRHRGSLHVRSTQKPGASGTVFTVFLPFNAATR